MSVSLRDSRDAVQVLSLPYSHAGFPGPLECLSVPSQAQVRSRTQPGLTALCWFIGLSHSQGLRCVVGQARDQCREQTSSAGASLGAVTGYSLLRLITRAFNALLEQQRSSIWWKVNACLIWKAARTPTKSSRLLCVGCGLFTWVKPVFLITFGEVCVDPARRQMT